MGLSAWNRCSKLIFCGKLYSLAIFESKCIYKAVNWKTGKFHFSHAVRDTQKPIRSRRLSDNQTTIRPTTLFASFKGTEIFAHTRFFSFSCAMNYLNCAFFCHQDLEWKNGPPKFYCFAWGMLSPPCLLQPNSQRLLVPVHSVGPMICNKNWKCAKVHFLRLTLKEINAFFHLLLIWMDAALVCPALFLI